MPLTPLIEKLLLSIESIDSKYFSIPNSSIDKYFRKIWIKEKGHKIHDLRHTFGSQLLENGATQKYVQTQMGHSSSRITLDIYNHLLPDSYQKADEIMDNLYLAS